MQAGKEFGSGEGILGLRLREMQNHAQIAAEKNTTVRRAPLLFPYFRAVSQKFGKLVEGEHPCGYLIAPICQSGYTFQ